VVDWHPTLASVMNSRNVMDDLIEAKVAAKRPELSCAGAL
jgi:hypothetical protein